MEQIEQVTKDDLRQLRMVLMHDIEKLLEEKIKTVATHSTDEQSQEWLRSKAIRSILNVSPATLQNLRISGKIRFRKVMGSYYYNRKDIIKLFGDGDR
ncbi:helix-turn-helix domain-containing protein [Chryseobacterium gallinarum]|uniref:helix-turn-helix domain-containing protein n=1 Tax=Chryseobacterium gallinarum TaxID=1324352 RepID=UPI002023F21F|nr:helix-turn-helix domain-containing protein [Chryseobacterium gallinarum]MCL8537633.1 helix-turn-helix domain-containing protein [Chryseobacterium gallinarum]